MHCSQIQLPAPRLGSILAQHPVQPLIAVRSLPSYIHWVALSGGTPKLKEIWKFSSDISSLCFGGFSEQYTICVLTLDGLIYLETFEDRDTQNFEPEAKKRKLSGPKKVPSGVISTYDYSKVPVKEIRVMEAKGKVDKLTSNSKIWSVPVGFVLARDNVIEHFGERVLALTSRPRVLLHIKKPTCVNYCTSVSSAEEIPTNKKQTFQNANIIEDRLAHALWGNEWSDLIFVIGTEGGQIQFCSEKSLSYGTLATLQGSIVHLQFIFIEQIPKQGQVPSQGSQRLSQGPTQPSNALLVTSDTGEVLVVTAMSRFQLQLDTKQLKCAWAPPHFLWMDQKQTKALTITKENDVVSFSPPFSIGVISGICLSSGQSLITSIAQNGKLMCFNASQIAPKIDKRMVQDALQGLAQIGTQQTKLEEMSTHIDQQIKQINEALHATGSDHIDCTDLRRMDVPDRGTPDPTRLNSPKL